MKRDDILAVIVSFNGPHEIRHAVDALKSQLGHILIVDNGSDSATRDALESLENLPGITVERLGENRGIGYALNLGVKLARRLGYSWLLTMDQDSLTDSSFIQAYCEAIESRPFVASLAPCIVTDGRPREAGVRVVSYAVTSGNMVRVSVFDEVGLYDEGFFIDCVDFDFSLRLRSAGHKIYRVPTALLRHQLGDPVALPSCIRRFYARHNPVRRYYMFRNYMYMIDRYIFRFPWFITKLGVSHLLLLLQICLFDAQPLASYRAVAYGLRDYLLGRQGPYLKRFA